jgi:DNA topoisomerase-1
VRPDGKVQPISSDDVNNYLREITARDFTSKDFRTWKGSVPALSVLSDMGRPTSQTRAHKNIVRAIKEAAAALARSWRRIAFLAQAERQMPQP